MKPKSALFISAALTAFVIAILASVVSAFNTAKTNDVAATASSTDVSATDTATQPDATVTATAPVRVSPEQAASIAAQFLKQSDVYSVEGITLNGVNVYKVVFSSGPIVYVGLDGVVISSATPTPQPTISYSLPAPTPKKHRSNGGGGGGGGGGGDDGGGDH